MGDRLLLIKGRFHFSNHDQALLMCNDSIFLFVIEVGVSLCLFVKLSFSQVKKIFFCLGGGGQSVIN